MEAIKKVRSEKRSVKSVAAAHGFNRQTLTKILVKFDAAVPDISKVPNDELLEIVQRVGKSWGNVARMVCEFVFFLVNYCAFFNFFVE